MAKKKLQDKKAKAKEKATAKEKHQAKLFAIRRKRAEREKSLLERHYRDRVDPIRNQKQLAKIEENLEHNLDVLRALEEEYLATQKKKANLQEELEAEGYKTIEEKMDALKKQSIEMVGRIRAEVEVEAASEKILSQLVSDDIKDVEFKNKVITKNTKKISEDR
jgi:chromosome segregation ATPase